MIRLIGPVGMNVRDMPADDACHGDTEVTRGTSTKLADAAHDGPLITMLVGKDPAMASEVKGDPNGV